MALLCSLIADYTYVATCVLSMVLGFGKLERTKSELDLLTVPTRHIGVYTFFVGQEKWSQSRLAFQSDFSLPAAHIISSCKKNISLDFRPSAVAALFGSKGVATKKGK